MKLHVPARNLLGMALLLALAIRLYLLWQYYCISPDGVHYIGAARDFFHGRFMAGLSSFYPPAYPLFISSLYSLIGEWELAGQIWSLLSGVLLLIPLYALLKSMYGEKVALTACFLAAIGPYLARYSVHVRTESPYLLLSTIALLLLHRGIERSFWSHFFYGGLVAGLAYLVRPEAVGFLVIVPLTLAVRCWVKGDKSIRWFCGTTLLLFIGFSLLAFPYILYLRLDTGEWTLSRKMGVTLWISLKESGLVSGEELKGMASDSLTLFRLATHYPLLFAKKFLLDLLSSLGVYLEALHYAYIPFLFIGLLHFFRDRFWRREDFLLLVFLVFYLVGFALIYPNRRYALQMVPISMGWTAAGVLWCWDYLKASVSPRAFRKAVAALAVTFLAGTLPKTLYPISRDKAYLREAGQYLKRLKGPGELSVLVFDGRIPFYAEARPVLLGDLTEEELVRYLHYGKADYLATEVRLWLKHYPSIARDPGAHGLVMERQFQSTRKDELLLFKVQAKKKDDT